MKSSMSKRIQFSVRMEEDIKAWLELLASLRGFDSLNDYIEDMARRDIDSLDESTRQQIITLREKLARQPAAVRPFAASPRQANRKAAS